MLIVLGGQEDVKIFVGNINKEKVTSRDLEDAFAKYGTVTEAVVVEKYGFVHMNSRDDARIAISRLNRTEINGCSIDVQFSTGENRRGGGAPAGPGGRRGEPDRRGGRGSRDPYYDDYYYPPPRRGDPFERRPPPPDPYYRGRGGFDPRDDMYARRPPRGDPYYDYYPPPRGDPRDPYGYPPRDVYGYDREFERDLPPRREFRDDPAASRSRYPPPPPVRREQADPYDDHYGRTSAVGGSDAYGVRGEYGGGSPGDPYGKRGADPYASGAASRRSAGGMKAENFAEDSYSAVSRSAPGGSSGLYTSMSSEYPGEKRPMPSSSYGGPPPKRGTYSGAQGGSAYGYWSHIARQQLLSQSQTDFLSTVSYISMYYIMILASTIGTLGSQLNEIFDMKWK